MYAVCNLSLVKRLGGLSTSLSRQHTRDRSKRETRWHPGQNAEASELRLKQTLPTVLSVSDKNVKKPRSKIRFSSVLETAQTTALHNIELGINSIGQLTLDTKVKRNDI